MSVYKEGFYAVRTIRNSMKQVYPDAADFGAPVRKGDELWNWAKQAVDWYGVEGTRKVERYLTGVTVTADIELMYEGDGPQRGEVLRFRIEYVSASGLKGGYMGYLTCEEVR